MSESDGGGGNSGNGSRKRSNSSAGGGRTSPSPPRNASPSAAAFDAPAAAAAPAPAPAPGPSSKKKQKKGSRGSSTGVQAFVPPGVVISRSPEDCAPQLTMPHKDQLTVVGNKGFRMARATHGVSNGTWYWECTVLPPETKEGHCRLGWSLATGSLQAPVGYDKSSYAYRDIAGSKVHESLRTDNYGEPWGEGDVIGFLIKLKSPSEEEMIDTVGAASDSGRLSVAAAAAALAAGQSPSERAAKAAEAVAAGGANAFNEIRFFKNGRDQGVAFSGIKPGTYFPAVSLYMGGSVRANFGPEFVYPPPRSYGWKPVAALRPFTKDEIKSQRNTIKRERASRGLETATRLIGGAPPLPSLNGSGNTSGNGSGSSRSASPPPPPPPPPPPSSVGPSKNDKTLDKGKGGRGEGEGSGKGRASPPPKDDEEGDRRPGGEAATASKEALVAASGVKGQRAEAKAETETGAASTAASGAGKEEGERAGTGEKAARPGPSSDSSKRESIGKQEKEGSPAPPVEASGKQEASEGAEADVAAAAAGAAAVPVSGTRENPEGTASPATANPDGKGAKREERENGARKPAAAPQKPQDGLTRPTDEKGSSEGGGNGERERASGDVSGAAAAPAAEASSDGRKGDPSDPCPMDVEEESGRREGKAAPEGGVSRDAEAGTSAGSSGTDGSSRGVGDASEVSKGTKGEGAGKPVATAAAETKRDEAVVTRMEIDEGGSGGLNTAGDKDAGSGDNPKSSSQGSKERGDPGSMSPG